MHTRRPPPPAESGSAHPNEPASLPELLAEVFLPPAPPPPQRLSEAEQKQLLQRLGRVLRRRKRFGWNRHDGASDPGATTAGLVLDWLRAAHPRMPAAELARLAAYVKALGIEEEPDHSAGPRAVSHEEGGSPALP